MAKNNGVKADEKPAGEERGANEARLSLPLGGVETSGYMAALAARGRVIIDDRGVHLNVQLGSRAAHAFIRVRNGLRDAHAKLPDGKPVYSNADALRYVFEQIADMLPN